MTEIRMLTLTQPWATLVAVGAKTIETRSWATSYRGPIAIHAADGLKPVGGPQGLVDLVGSPPFLDALSPHVSGYTDVEIAANLPRGAIVAVGLLRDVVQTGQAWSPDPDAYGPNERAFGDYSPGRYAWILDVIRDLVNPIPTRGGLGLPRLRDPDALAELDRIWDPSIYVGARP